LIACVIIKKNYCTATTKETISDITLQASSKSALNNNTKKLYYALNRSSIPHKEYIGAELEKKN
jgi:hypothetical protein